MDKMLRVNKNVKQLLDIIVEARRNNSTNFSHITQQAVLHDIIIKAHKKECRE